MVSEKHSCVFIHINRTGGASIEQALGRDSKTKANHLSARHQARKLGMRQFREYFSFSIVRNPWEKMVSMFHHPAHQRFGHVSFDEWIKTLDSNERLRYTSNQLDWLTTKSWVWDVSKQRFSQKPESSLLMVDFVGRFERLQDDWNFVCEQLEIPATKLPHRNKSDYGKSYQSFYTPESRQIIAGRFERDIEYFDYIF